MERIFTTACGEMPVLYEDDYILVLSKPHGLHTVQDRFGEEGETARSILDGYYGKIYVVHRLDASTGGVMVFAKDSRSHRTLSMQFEKSEVRKEYLAVTVKAAVPPVTVMLPISAKIAHGKYKINFKSGRPAFTTVLPLKEGAKGNLVRVVPHTGRTHQIRVHLKALKAPVYKDWIYHIRTDERRIPLFAESIAFFHPATGEKIEFTAELSGFMKACMAECGI